MKKIILITLAMVFVATAVFSQVPMLPKLGIKAGINMANGWGDDVENSSWKLGFFGGGYIGYGFNPMFDIQGELLFCMKGAKSEPNDSTTYTSSLNYIDIPVLLKFNFPTVGFGTSIYGGIDMGILITAETEVDEGGNKTTTDIKDDLNSIDFGAVIGADLDYNNVILDVRYTIGLTNVMKEVSGVQVDSKNQVISFGLGYRFF